MKSVLFLAGKMESVGVVVVDLAAADKWHQWDRHSKVNMVLGSFGGYLRWRSRNKAVPGGQKRPDKVEDWLRCPTPRTHLVVGEGEERGFRGQVVLHDSGNLPR